MPECENCGSHVTDQYARVFARDGDHSTVDVCPHCPDMIRGARGRPREARSHRQDTTDGDSTYDPAKDPTAEVATDGGEQQ